MGAVIIIPLVMILLAIIGLHPFITIVFFGKNVTIKLNAKGCFRSLPKQFPQDSKEDNT